MNAPTRHRSGSAALFISGAVFVAIAVAMMVGAVLLARTDSTGYGEAEAAGFLFMTGLAPFALGGILVVVGFVVFLRDVSRR